MALNAQANWNVEMAEKPHISETATESSAATTSSPLATSSPRKIPREVHLPVEIILHIVSLLPRREASQKTLWVCCQVSKAWYEASISRLYERPYVTSRNFQEFVRTVCPSKNAHIRKSELAELVRYLDMSGLSYDGSKSLTARLLGRLKNGLRKFIAPQAVFGINCFASLSKCTELEYLNLSLISASISLKLLYQTLKPLKSLRILFLPRSSSKNEVAAEIFWPPKLHALHLAGGIDNTFLENNLHELPETLKVMSIQHCAEVSPLVLELFLQCVGPRLRELKLSYPMRSLKSDSLNGVLSWCPNLDILRINVEFVTPEFLSNVSGEHPLRILDLDCSGESLLQFPPTEISKNLTLGLTSLRSVRADSKLGWTKTEEKTQETEDLSDLLSDLDAEKPLGVEPGVWVF